MPIRIDRKILQAEIVRGITEFYPYFLGFYFLSLAIAVFSKTWRGFFYWPAFHIAAAASSMLFVLAFRADGGLRIRQTMARFRQNFIFIRFKLSQLDRRARFKIFLIAAILVVAALYGIGVVRLFVLLYALASVLFVFGSRRSVAVVLALLTACPILLVLKKDQWAETAAVYAYYFLVIAVMTQIREFKRSHVSVDKSIDSVAADKKT